MRDEWHCEDGAAQPSSFECQVSRWWREIKLVACLIALNAAYGGLIGSVIGLVRWLGGQSGAIVVSSLLDGSLAGAFVAGLFGIGILFDRTETQELSPLDSGVRVPDAASADQIAPGAAVDQHEYH
jgi:hypothetical protein